MTRMTFDEAVGFIMDRLEPADHERRATRDKVRKRVRFGLGDGKLQRLDMETTDVDRNELIKWAQTKWPGKFNMPVVVHGDLHDTVNLAVAADARRLPGTVAECHQLIHELVQNLHRLELRNLMMMGEIAHLRPMADRYAQIRDQNRASAQKPRSG